MPYELTLTAKLSMDVNLLYAEQDKYVPSQEAGDSEGDNGKQVSFAIGYKINHLCGLRI